jgi:hypothetical protein
MAQCLKPVKHIQRLTRGEAIGLHFIERGADFIQRYWRFQRFALIIK